MEYRREDSAPEEPTNGLPEVVADALEEVEPVMAPTESGLERLLRGLRDLS